MPSGIYKRTEEHIRNLGLAQIGRIHSEKSKKRMSLAKTGVYKKIIHRRIPAPYPELKEDCLVCVSHCKSKEGYPRIWRNGKFVYMSRYLWESCYGEIPEGMLVLHKCDNPSCINPGHFFLGTNQDNMDDMGRKGRQRKATK